jgi:hypothetical protein
MLKWEGNSGSGAPCGRFVRTTPARGAEVTP